MQDGVFSPGVTASEGEVPLPKPFPLAMRVHGATEMSVKSADSFPVERWQTDYLAHAPRWAWALRSFPGRKCLHGEFYDLKPSASEPELRDLTHRRAISRARP